MDEIKDIKKVKLEKDDVIIVRVNLSGKQVMSNNRIKHFFNEIRRELKKVFPNNQILVMEGNIQFDIINKETVSSAAFLDETIEDFERV